MWAAITSYPYRCDKKTSPLCCFPLIEMMRGIQLLHGSVKPLKTCCLTRVRSRSKETCRLVQTDRKHKLNPDQYVSLKGLSNSTLGRF